VSNWLETYRGVVNPWECDVVQHFTIAYYFDLRRRHPQLLRSPEVGDSLDAACATAHRRVRNLPAGAAGGIVFSCSPP
jgi:hypothetical protein